MATSKRELWFTLIRVTVVVVLIGTAARLVAIAYAPQGSAVPQQLNCPPEVVTPHETVLPPQVLAVTEQSATNATSDDGLPSKADVRSTIGKKEERRSGAKKPTTYAPTRNSVSQKRVAMGNPAKRGEIDANQPQKRKAPMPTLAHSGISQSTFDDRHGQ